MICSACSHDNRAGAKFCEECAAPLVRRCADCGADVRPGGKFCDACGASVVAPAASRRADARKVVTIVFADLLGSTALHERLDAESARGLMDRYYVALGAAVEAHGGRVVKLLGDGVMAAFGVPRVAEDDAIRAVRAAAGMQQAFREHVAGGAPAGEMGLRAAVNTGEVVVSADNDDVVGDPVNVAARLQQEARDGEVLLGEATQRLVRELVTLAPAGVFSLKGRAEPVRAYRVVSLDRPPGAAATAFVGRDEELARLTAVYDAARTAPAARLAVVIGSPGLGKSRLLDEFTRRLDGATVLVAHCEAAGGSTFAPLAQALRAALGVAAGAGGDDLRRAIDAAVPGGEADRGRIAAGVGALLAGTPAAPEETFFVVRRLLTGLAVAQPVVFVLDDLHWAEPLLLDLVEHLVQWSTGVPLFLLAAARPELRDARSALASPGRLATDVVMLAGLDAAAATRLAANVLGAEALPAAVAGRVLASSEGNPLFLSALVRMLVDDGALKREGDRWTAGVDLAALEIPPTIHALLAARIERLRPDDRLVLERAAIIGRQFSRAAVAHVLPRQAQRDLDARLEALRRSELVEADTTWFLGEPALRFHHALIRDAAYRRVLKGTRAQLHERVADWIESRAAGAVEHDETIGWHLEQAHRHLGELGPLDDRGRALGERAARYLAAAGRRALARDDVPVAADLLGRALARLDPADPARAELALDWCEALLAAGEVGPAAQALDELGRFTAGSARLRAWHTCLAGERAALTDPQSLHATVAAVAAAAGELAAAGDGAGEAKAHWVHAIAFARLGRVGACEAALDQALAAARRADDRRRSNAVLANAPLAALWGPSPVARASGRCLDVVRVLRITEGAPGVEAVALRCQAVLEALRDRSEAARRMIASSRHMVEELGMTRQLLETGVFAGLIDLLEGDAAAAERGLRGAYEGLRSHGLGIDAAQAAAFLGRALLAQGRGAEAEALSHESETLAGDDLQAAITWRGVRAEALAQRGLYAEAVDFARAAVDIASATDALLHHADARLALAAALRAAGRYDDAAAEEARAAQLWEAKGASVLVERVRCGAGAASQMERASDGHAEAMSLRARPRARPNAASMSAPRILDAIAAGDADAIANHIADRSEVVDHTTGRTYDREGLVASLRSLLKAPDASVRVDGLATLGDSLALGRQCVSASGATGRTLDVGPYEIETIILVEVDGEQRRTRTEIFAADKLGAAIVRLYERHAEILPDGPERTRASATARSVAALWQAPPDADRMATAIAPEVECIDHRPLVSLPPLHGAEAFLGATRALLDLVEKDTFGRVDDILGLAPDGLLVRWTILGTARAGGGAYELEAIVLQLFGADGLLARYEIFAPQQADEALSRFDELAAKPVPRSTCRRVRANRATVAVDRIDAALAARDARAIASLHAEDLRAVHHVTGTILDQQGVLNWWGAYLGDHDVSFHSERLAALAASLALIRLSWTGSATNDPLLAVGGFAGEELDLLQVDAEGRAEQIETFAADHLADAVVRLYERYAALLPEGPERTRIAATARAVAAHAGPLDLDRLASVYAPDIEGIDHRILGTWSARGLEALRERWRTWLELVDVATRFDDILALGPDALVCRVFFFGTDRAGGGPFELPTINLFAFGPDGRVARAEVFDRDRDAEALARFDALTTAPRATRVENAATRALERGRDAWAARDWVRFAALFPPGFRIVERRRIVQLETDRDAWLASFLPLLEMSASPPTFEVLATRGDRLALSRWIAMYGGGDVGPSEIPWLMILEVDECGEPAAAVTFDPDDLDAASAELDEIARSMPW